MLTAHAETIYDRVKGNSDRPLLNGNMSLTYIEELMEERQERYEEAADMIVSTDSSDIEVVVHEICKKLR